MQTAVTPKKHKLLKKILLLGIFLTVGLFTPMLPNVFPWIFFILIWILLYRRNYKLGMISKNTFILVHLKDDSWIKSLLSGRVFVGVISMLWAFLLSLALLLEFATTKNYLLWFILALLIPMLWKQFSSDEFYNKHIKSNSYQYFSQKLTFMVVVFFTIIIVALINTFALSIPIFEGAPDYLRIYEFYRNSLEINDDILKFLASLYVSLESSIVYLIHVLNEFPICQKLVVVLFFCFKSAFFVIPIIMINQLFNLLATGDNHGKNN